MDILDLLNTPVFTLGAVPVPISDLIGNICALATVYLALRRNILSWPVQILGSILLLSASIGAGLGGNASRQVVIIAAAVWGWTRWKAAKEEAGEVQVRWGTWKERIWLIAVLAAGTAGFGALLDWGGWSWNPYPDAYIFVGSLVAMVAQGRAIVEFWFVWLAVDLVGIPLAISGGLLFSGIVYLIFLVMVIIGIVDWGRRSKQRISSPHDISADVSRPDPA
ncbi:nicotinamide mononucleotide transporter family protein [Brevibacterium album]|uniref:nicotinamide mononucleotide transporter family protein n=1 Tax=Brevibacterium album TaxID=417948 RepID=UPI0005537EDD|nr:nicotinamide mononucleotide transporter family protein [Brevibacterium album]